MAPKDTTLSLFFSTCLSREVDASGNFGIRGRFVTGGQASTAGEKEREILLEIGVKHPISFHS